MEKNEKKEFVFYYESRQNPNGDPGFENQPRKQPDDTIIITDVRIKRTIRDYAKSKGEVIFVDYNEKNEHTRAKDRAEKICDKSIDGLKLLERTFDVPLFGALVPISEDKKGAGSSLKITGPVQLAIGRSVNKVTIINPQISSIFSTQKEKKSKKEDEEAENKMFGTFGTFYSVEYALIKTYGAINPTNLGTFYENAFKYTQKAEVKLFDYLWNGTNQLVTRSKYPQRSIFYLEVTYKDSLYNDLNELIQENAKMHGEDVKEIIKPLFDFSRLLDAFKARKDKIKGIRIAACHDIADEAEELKKKLESTVTKDVELINTN
ncbi:MAG: type I CRISPR-associated protein Cas7 [Candidatus Micrarchaeaceae archaeon]